MLVLIAKSGEDIIIDDNIHLTIVAIKGETVRLGITAPEKSLWTDRRFTKNARAHFSKGQPYPSIPTGVIGTMPG